MPDGSIQTRADFDHLYRRFAARLRNFIRVQVGNADLAADLVQETFLRLLRSGLQIRTEQEVSAYLFRTASSVLVDHWRRERLARIWRLLLVRPEPPAAAMTTDMERAFRALKPRDRTLLWLAYVEEMSQEEVAAVMGVERGSVKVMLFRARKQLAGILKDKGLVWGALHD